MTLFKTASRYVSAWTQNNFNALSLMLTSTKTVDVIRPFRKGSALSSECTRLYRLNVVD